MHRLIAFIKQIYVVLIFLLVEGVAIWCYATSTPYTESKIVARVSVMGGAVSGVATDIKHFFSLPRHNRELTARVAELEQMLQRDWVTELSDSDSLSGALVDIDQLHFRYHPSRVVSMTTGRMRNYIIIDRGTDDGISENMGVITPNRELVGYITACSERYSVVMSVLNTSFGIGGCLTENDYSCSVRWDGGSTHYVELIDLSTYAEPKEGMLVEVRSERMPEGIAIGYIESYELNPSRTAYSARVRLATDLSTLDNIIIVENTHYGEIEALMDGVE